MAEVAPLKHDGKVPGTHHIYVLFQLHDSKSLYKKMVVNHHLHSFKKRMVVSEFQDGFCFMFSFGCCHFFVAGLWLGIET